MTISRQKWMQHKQCAVLELIKDDRDTAIRNCKDKTDEALKKYIMKR